MLGSLLGEVVSTQRPVSFIRQTFFPVYAQGNNRLSQVPVLPFGACPALGPRWCFPTLALARRKLLPSLIGEWVGFSIFPLMVISIWTTRFRISGLYHMACLLTIPASHPPLLMMHAGSLLSCWLSFAQLGLSVTFTHWVTTTSFLLAPSPRHGLSWRDTDRSRWIVHTRPKDSSKSANARSAPEGSSSTF